MSATSLRHELVDLADVRRRGDRREKETLARRIFALWSPIFSHLDGQDYTYHLHKHVEDETAVQIRGLFGVDAGGQDRALVIVRVHEHELGGRIWARLTINAGVEAGYVQAQFGQTFVVREMWRYRIRHPRRPFFAIDAAVSAASYGVYEKHYRGLVPTASCPIPEAWWPLAECGAGALGGLRVTGTRPEVRRFGVTVRDPRSRRPASERSRQAARFFEEMTGGDPTLGLLVMAPLALSPLSATTATYGLSRARRLWATRGRSA